MQALLGLIPKPLLILIAVSLGVAFYIYTNPPVSKCDAQKENYQNALAGHIYPQTGRFARAPVFDQAFEKCKIANSQGGCHELFSVLRRATRELRGSPRDCRREISLMPPVRRVLRTGLLLMSQLAWGEEPPELNAKLGWLDLQDVALFCELSDLLNQTMTESEWETYRNTVMTSMPGATELSFEEQWQRGLFSLRCEYYL